MLKQKSFEMEFAGRKLSVEVGKLARQTNASCIVRYGDTVILATAVISKEARSGIDFFPLQVEVREKMYAAGKIKGSKFIKGEGRPTDNAVLAGRMIDRGIRPLFNQQMRNEVQLVLTTLSYDKENPFDTLSIVAGAIALHISDIPWNGPLAGINVGRVDGNFIVNDLTLAEFYGVMLKNYGEAQADLWFKKLERYSLPLDKETLIEAIKFRHTHKKTNISFFDAVGYI
ncbi:MAG: polyribonucleotide nucleotidyltransferase, partial [Patescibacteria group bacterium]